MLHYATDIIRVCSEILFSERLCRLEASYLIFDANLLTGFSIEGSFTEKCYGTIHDLFLFTCCCCCCCCFFWKLEIGLTYVTSFYSEHICTRCCYLYSLTLFGVSWYLLVCKLAQTNFKKVLNKITAKYEKRGKYLPILREATCNNYFIVKCLFK